jgi:hypothetical protein
VSFYVRAYLDRLLCVTMHVSVLLGVPSLGPP